MVIKSGQIISHYKILRKLGAGGMGEVYLAEDTKLPRKVALKFLAQAYADFPEYKARFKREAEAVALIRHPNIIVIHEIGEFANRPYFVMEYIEGESLGELIARKELQIHDVIDMLIQVCDGLRKAHQQGVIHRDIKPSNILIDQDRLVKIVDFGLAKLRDASIITEKGTQMGTFPYMPPEQDLGQELDQRSDIFSLGVVLYELITRRLPFQGAPEAILYARLHLEPEPLARYKNGVSAGLQRILDKALDKDRETRYQNVESILADLKKERKLFSSLPVMPHLKVDDIDRSLKFAEILPHPEFKRPVNPPMTDGLRLSSSTGSMPPVVPLKLKTRRRRKLLPALSAVVVILLAGLAAYLYFGQKPPVNKPVLPEKMQVSISSKPAGATVSRNGDSIGVTPLNISAMDGETIKLRIRKSNYYSIDTSVVAQTGQDSTFLFALRPLAQISLQVTPDNAEVVLDGKMIPLSQFKEMKLPTGLHRISISAEGYEPIAEQFSLLQGANPTRRYELKKPVVPPPPNLEPRKIPILISSNPNGATVFLNGDNVGVTPLRLATKDNATLKVLLRRPDYFPLDTALVIRKGQDSTFLFALRPLAQISLQVTPDNAEVVLDRKTIPRSQFKEMKLSTGLHRISISAEGYEPIAEQFNLRQGANPTRRYELKKPVPPKPLVGSIRITSKPDSATILLNGREAGMTTKTIRDLEEGTYQIVLRKKGYKDYSASVQVISEQMLPLDFKLTALPGTLKVAVKPSGSIFIDGKLYARNIQSPFRQELPAGTHRLRVVNSDSVVWEKTVNIESEILLDVPIDFTKIYKLTITTTPVLGEISVDGKYRGSAPKQLALRTGQHAIKTRREGYVQADTTINLENDWQQPLKLILRKIP